MNWPDEQWRKLYVRDTAEWLALCWQARALLPLLLRKCDGSGVVQLKPGPSRQRLLGVLVGLPPEVVETGISDLLADGCLVESPSGFCLRNFVDAQEARASDKLRKAESRARRRASAIGHAASHGVTPGHTESQQVTKRDAESQTTTQRDQESRNVTECHTASHGVTLRREEKRLEEKTSDVVVSPSARDPVDELRDAWNLATAGTPIHQVPESAWQGNLRLLASRRLGEHPDVALWRAGFADLASSPFWRGETRDKGPVAFGWLVKDAERCRALLAGEYASFDQKRAAAPAVPAPTPRACVGCGKPATTHVWTTETPACASCAREAVTGEGGAKAWADSHTNRKGAA